MQHFDPPEMIPLFPLPGALLLPRGRLPLNVFEPRYLALVEDTLKSRERLIGIIQPRPAPQGKRRLAPVGCAGRISSFTETDDGRYLIVLTGYSRFRLGDEVAGFTPYVRAKVDWQPYDDDRRGPAPDALLDREAFLALLGRYFAARHLSTDWEGIRDAPDEMLINSLAMLLPFDPEDRQALLEAPTLAKRRETLEVLMEFALRSDGEGSLQ